MTTSLTTEQILGLAPDAASAKAGRGLATLRKWDALGHNERALWGECQGSGKSPYQTEVDLNGPAFKCTCPSRKFPCKHALGLLLLFAGRPDDFKVKIPPPWVVEWLEKRDRQALPKEDKTFSKENPDSEEKAKKETAKAKRASKREANVAAGLEDLSRWLRDLMRQGLAAVQSRPVRYWEDMAKRMVDAQAPGIARRLREISSIPSSGEGWTERLPAQLGKLYLIVEGFRHMDTLPPLVQEDLRTAIGWTYREEDIPDENRLRDHWLILGQRTYEEDRLRVQRTWLWGEEHAKAALILDFAYQGQPLTVSLMPGTSLDAELAFYPSHFPLRAAIKQTFSLSSFGTFSAYPTFSDFLTVYAEALSCHPWLEVFPAPLESVIPIKAGEKSYLRDAAGQMIPLSPQFDQIWRLLGVSGGRPLPLFGEWNGEYLLPLSTWMEGRWICL